MQEDLEEWQKRHNSPLTLGSEVIIKTSCKHFEPAYDTGMKFMVVMLYVDSGGLNVGLNDAVPLSGKVRDSYVCEVDGYRIDDLEPAVKTETD